MLSRASGLYPGDSVFRGRCAARRRRSPRGDVADFRAGRFEESRGTQSLDAERVLDWSGVPTVRVRPTFFSEWLIFPWVLDTIVNEGKITLPYGRGRHAPIAAEDQARFIATVLTHPSGHIGKTYELCGPVELDHQGIAEELSNVIDRKIVYSPATLDEYREHLQKYDLPEFVIQHFIEVAIDYQNGVFRGKDSMIEQITGKAPQTVEAFVRANRQLFGA